MYSILFRDRSTLVSLINELSGFKDTSNDTSPSTSPVNENEEECIINESADFKSDINIFDPREYSLEKPIHLKSESNEDSSLNEINTPIVGEIIEESVMIVKGEGSGHACDTGNPDETNTQNETLKNEDVKKPKLWSIETICSSSKEVQEDISVPKMGFFFGDDSVPCFNNVSNGENSHLINEKFVGSSSIENCEELPKKLDGELEKNKEIDQELRTNTKLDDENAKNKKIDQELITNKKLDEKLATNKTLDEELEKNIKLDDELETDKKLDEELKKNIKLDEELATNKKYDEQLTPDKKLDEELSKNIQLDEELATNIKYDEKLATEKKLNEVVDSTTSNSIESLDKQCSGTNAEDFSIKKTSKQSVFNIKVHEEEVQITERKANEVFTKSESIIKDNAHVTNIFESNIIDTHKELQESKLSSTIQVSESYSNDKSLNFDETNKLNTEQNKIVDEHEVDVKLEGKNNDDQIDIHLTNANMVANEDLHIINQESFHVKLPENSSIDDSAIKTNIHILENNLKTKKQSTSDVVEKVIKHCEHFNPNKLLLNSVDQCININEQQIDASEQNSSSLDRNPILNEVNLSVKTDNRILANKSNIIIDNNKEIVSLKVQSNESNRQITENVDEIIQATDDSNTNATYLKSKLNLLTKSDNSTGMVIQYSSENGSDKAHDQTLMDDVNQYPTTSKQIDDDQNYKKPNLTLHNISNIIETNKSVDDIVKEKNQSTNIEINKTEYCQIRNENNLVTNIIQEKPESVVNIALKTSNNKHSLDKILQKSVEVKEVIECPNYENNSTEELKFKVQPESFNTEVKRDDICMVKSEKNYKELKTKNLDLTVGKTDGELIEGKSNIALAIPSKQKEDNTTVCAINIPSESPKFDDKISAISMEDKNKPIVHEIKHNSKKDKQKLISDEHKTEVGYEGGLKNESYKKDNLALTVPIQNSNNTNEIVQDSKFPIIIVIMFWLNFVCLFI